MDRTQKKQLVEDLGEEFKSAPVLVVAHYAGLSVSEMSQLRSKARAQGASIRVVKNRLAKIALKGTNLEAATALLTGPTVLAFSSDVVSAPKAVVSYSGTNDKLVVLGGVMEGQFLDAAKMKALGNLPSLDELRGKLVGLLQAPAAKVARVLSAYADKDQ